MRRYGRDTEQDVERPFQEAGQDAENWKDREEGRVADDLDRDSEQGGYSQGGYNQGGYNKGDYDQGDYNQGGYNQGGYNQGGDNQGNY